MRQHINFGAFTNDPTADSARAGAIKIEHNFDVLFALWRALEADEEGANSDAVQTWFPGGGETQVTLPANSAWRFEGALRLARAAGTTSHTIALVWQGSAAIEAIDYVARSTVTDGNALGAVSAIRGDAASALIVTAASTLATENNLVEVRGVLRIGDAGTLIPQFQYSAAPGGAPTVKRGTYLRLVRLGLAAAGHHGWSVGS